MPRSIEIVLQDGESLESALRRFKRKVQQDDVIKEIKKHSFYLKPGEKRRVKDALAHKKKRLVLQGTAGASAQVKFGREGTASGSALLDLVMQRVRALPSNRKDAIASRILIELEEATPDPAGARFQNLIEAKYTRGLTSKEQEELQRLESGFQDAEESFYGPVLERLKEARREEKRTTRRARKS